MESNIESGKLFLRKLKIEEIDDRVLSWFADQDLMLYYTNSRNAITRESLIDSIEIGEKNGTSYTYGIFLNEGVCIGTIKLGPINIVHRISDLVVLIGDRNYHGKGLSVEAIQLGNKLAFETFDLRKLFGGMYASNISSIKAYLRAGWTAEAILKGHYLNKGKNEDRLEVGCFNPKYFTKEEIIEATKFRLEDILEKYSI